MAQTTYLLIDGENIDATLGMSVLERRPAPEERPRWDRVLESARGIWGQETVGLFFLNGSSGALPMPFVQALMAMNYRPIPLSGPPQMKVVDVGIQRMLSAINEHGDGAVVLASHDGDFVEELKALLLNGRQAAVVCFSEYLSSSLQDLVQHGLEVYDLERHFDAFQVSLPRLRIIDIDDFEPEEFL